MQWLPKQTLSHNTLAKKRRPIYCFFTYPPRYCKEPAAMTRTQILMSGTSARSVSSSVQNPPSMRRPPESAHEEPGRTKYDLELSDPAWKETWVVVVGQAPDISYFYFPKSVLEANSQFFTRATKAVWAITSNQVINLGDVKPAVFDLYARWMASGAKIMVELDDWKAEHDKYKKWRRKIEDNKGRLRVSNSKPLCPEDVWDFDLTTEAWFLGDYLQSRDFQNHCLGHLYYMHLRFDHLNLKNITSSQDPCDDPFESFWLSGTIAYIRIEDIIKTWEKTKHWQAKTSFELERHPLRRFFVDWLERYWDAYVILDYDHEVQDGIVKLIKSCPDLVYKQLCNLLSTEVRSNTTIREIGAYWVDADQYPQETQQRIDICDGTHYW